MPYPFTKGVFICGSPITVDRNSSDDELEEKRVLLQNSLMEITEKADGYFKK